MGLSLLLVLRYLPFLDLAITDVIEIAWIRWSVLLLLYSFGTVVQCFKGLLIAVLWWSGVGGFGWHFKNNLDYNELSKVFFCKKFDKIINMLILINSLICYWFDWIFLQMIWIKRSFPEISLDFVFWSNSKLSFLFSLT